MFAFLAVASPGILAGKEKKDDPEPPKYGWCKGKHPKIRKKRNQAVLDTASRVSTYIFLTCTPQTSRNGVRENESVCSAAKPESSRRQVIASHALQLGLVMSALASTAILRRQFAVDAVRPESRWELLLADLHCGA